MNDPHVVALIYKIEHGPSVDYSKAESLDREETDFHIQIANKEVRFEFKEHYATVDAARKAIEDYIRTWEFDVGLRRGPDYFKLKYDRAQREDRNPTPGVACFHFRAGEPTVTVRAIVSPPCYPPPPSGVLITPDVQTMYDRYMSSRQSREPLPTMAHFCLNMLEFSTKKEPNEKKKRRELAAEMYGIEREVLDKIGELAGTKGGKLARKAAGKDNELTAQDRRFLNKAIEVVIRRAAEKAHDPDSDLPEISLSDLLTKK